MGSIVGNRRRAAVIGGLIRIPGVSARGPGPLCSVFRWLGRYRLKPFTEASPFLTGLLYINAAHIRPLPTSGVLSVAARMQHPNTIRQSALMLPLTGLWSWGLSYQDLAEVVSLRVSATHSQARLFEEGGYPCGSSGMPPPLVRSVP
jgi:hypothetical protein